MQVKKASKRKASQSRTDVAVYASKECLGWYISHVAASLFVFDHIRWRRDIAFATSADALSDDTDDNEKENEC